MKTVFNTNKPFFRFLFVTVDTICLTLTKH